MELYDRKARLITVEKWGQLREDEAYRRIAEETTVDASGKTVWISTVWIGINYNFLGDGPPLIFETMVFGGDLDQMCERTPTEAAALACHDRWCAKVREGDQPDEDD